MLWHQMALNQEIAWLGSHPAYFLRAASNYARFSRGLGLGLGRQWRGLANPRARLLWLACLPLGLLLAWRDRRRAA